ncbi:hypothetical protein D5086_014018 [Populus alba]|uniref:Uncharacterized protein n=1 Tax=Populus alba TaxID=43335 RepID=A0ACC4C7G5_POPAL
MSSKSQPNINKLPWFENFARPGFKDSSAVHELPYDHSILLENLMDPAHIPISHDRTDLSAERENAQPLRFEVTERTDRGFAGWWGGGMLKHCQTSYGLKPLVSYPITENSLMARGDGVIPELNHT